MKITTVKDKRIAAIVQEPAGTKVKGLQPKEAEKIRAMIFTILKMRHPNQLMTVASWKAHELSPSRPNVWSLRVTPNYRLTFYVDIEAQEVSDLDFEDYH